MKKKLSSKKLALERETVELIATAPKEHVGEVAGATVCGCVCSTLPDCFAL